MAHFIVTIEKILAEGLARLFRDYIWKLHGLCYKIVPRRKTISCIFLNLIDNI